MDWKEIPALSALRAFEATARLLSFSKAARELNVTHAAIAQQVRKLEAEFAESLVYREGRGLGITDNGAELAQSLRTGFAEIEVGVKRLRAFKETRPLNISVTAGFASQWLMPRIGDFWNKHPDIQVNINPSSNLVDLTRDGFDMAIRFGNGDWPGLTVEQLVQADYCVVAHPKLLVGRNATCLSDLKGIPWMLDSTITERRALLQAEGVDTEKVIIKEFLTNEMTLAAAIAGVGLSIQTTVLVAEKVARGELIKVCEFSQAGLSYHIVTRKGHDHKQLNQFKKWLRDMTK